MNINLINPLIVSFTDTLPQLGFQSVERLGISLIGSKLDYDGILVHISLVGLLKGAILIGMSLDSAKQFASKMMMGRDGQATLPVPQTLAVHFLVDSIDINVYIGLLRVRS